MLITVNLFTSKINKKGVKLSKKRRKNRKIKIKTAGLLANKSGNYNRNKVFGSLIINNFSEFEVIGNNFRNKIDIFFNYKEFG